jgi:hypothetical protein
LIKAGNRKNFAIEIASIQRDGKYAYQTGRWTIDQVKDNGEVTKVGGNTVRFSKNRRTASGWPRSTFTIFINWALGWSPNCVHPKSDSIVEHVAGVDDFEVAEATYRAAVARWPAVRITLRQGIGGSIIFRIPRDVQSPRPPTTALVQKIALTAIVDQADNST